MTGDELLVAAGLPELPSLARFEVLEAAPELLRLRHPGAASRLFARLPDFLGLALVLGLLFIGVVFVLGGETRSLQQFGLFLAIGFVASVSLLGSTSLIRSLMRVEIELRPDLLAVTRTSSLWRSHQRLQLAPGAQVRLRAHRVNEVDRYITQVFGARYTLAMGAPFDTVEERWLAEAANAFLIAHFDPSAEALDEAPRSVLRVRRKEAHDGLTIDLIGARSTVTGLQRLLLASLLVGVMSYAGSGFVPWQESPVLAAAMHLGFFAAAVLIVCRDRLYFYRVTADRKRVSVQLHRRGTRRGFEYSMHCALVLGLELRTDSSDPGCFVRGALRSVNLTPEHDLGTAVHVGRLVVRHLREIGAEIEAPAELDVPPADPRG